MAHAMAYSIPSSDLRGPALATQDLAHSSVLNVATFQGVFYITTGIWPLVHMKSFEKVTGPKTDHWLVKTVGLLVAISGLALLRSGLRAKSTATERPQFSQDATLIGIGQAACLGSVSLYYSAIGRISKVYMLDTLVEYSLVLNWIGAIRAQR